MYGLVNNAGVYLGKNLLDYEENEIDFVMDINIKGYVYFSKYFGELLMKKETEGAIINYRPCQEWKEAPMLYMECLKQQY